MTDEFPPPVPHSNDSGDSSQSGSSASSNRSRSGVVAAVLLIAVVVAVVAFFVFGASDEGENDGPSDSSPLPSTVVDGSTETATATTMAPVIVEPATSAPAEVVPVTEPIPVDTRPAYAFTLANSSFYSVGVFSEAPVRGSGCGSGNYGDPTLPDQLPDGIWFGSLGPYYEDFPPYDDQDVGFGYTRFDGKSLEIDLWCVYTGPIAQEKYEDPVCQSNDDCWLYNSAWWFTEDNSDRLRSLPVSPDYIYSAPSDVVIDSYPGCVEDDPFTRNAAWRNGPVWIAVNNGQVTEILGSCDYLGGFR